MRRIVFATFAALSIAACSNESTGPDASTLLAISTAGTGTAFTLAGGYDGDLYQTRLANGLPDSLKLSNEQQAKIKELVKAFEAATKADRDSLNKMLRDAKMSADKRGYAAEVAKILADAAPIVDRLKTAEAKLKADIDAVLTAEQRAWLAEHSPAKCKPEKFPALTDAQKAQIRALEKAFEDNNKADLDAVKAAMDSAKGKTKEEAKAILDAVAPARARLDAARKALKDAIAGVLTADQKNSGCLPLG
jgi:Spy/CpxP family protein refolding chaperone